MSQRQHNEDRMRRAKSWHERSLRAESDDDRFIFLWIAFNAAYGSELNGSENGNLPAREREKFLNFLREVLMKDTQSNIVGIFRKEAFKGRVYTLLGNVYIFRRFWWKIQGSTNDNWDDIVKIFNKRNKEAWIDVLNGNGNRALEEIFKRLYTLRNQILHGGVTYRSGKGRDQIRDGAEIMAELVPEVLKIMQADIEQNPESSNWGRVAYPTVIVRIDGITLEFDQ